MGETKKYCFKLDFTDKVKAYFKGSEITSDGGLIAIRELDEKMGLTILAEKYLTDKRNGRNIQHDLTELLRQSIYSRLAGYEDVNDAKQLRNDPSLRAVLGERAYGSRISRTMRTRRNGSWPCSAWRISDPPRPAPCRNCSPSAPTNFSRKTSAGPPPRSPPSDPRPRPPCRACWRCLTTPPSRPPTAPRPATRWRRSSLKTRGCARPS